MDNSFAPMWSGDEEYNFQGEFDELFGNELSGDAAMSGMDDDLFGDNAPEAENRQTWASLELAKSGPSFLLRQPAQGRQPTLTLPTLPQQPTREHQDSLFSPTHMYPELPLSFDAAPTRAPVPAPKRAAPASRQAPAPAPAPAPALTMPDYLGQAPNSFAQNQSYTNLQSLDMANEFMFDQPPMLPPAPLMASQPLPPMVHEGKKLTHNRNQKYKDNDPSKIYMKPAGVLPWGPMTRERIPQPMFEYNNSSAELLPFKSYSKDELITFFTSCPDQNRKLTLWIQNTPAQSNNRYAMGPSSGKCRYKGCPAPQKTILKGFFRVAFDEFSDQTGTVRDPFHNAGYMHLHCFEELFDLSFLIHYGARYRKFNIRADWRHFPYECRNPMALDRDHQSMGNFFNEWVQAQRLRCDQLHQDNLQNHGNKPRYDGFHPDGPTPHRRRLGYKLTVSHLSLEFSGRAQARDARGGAHIGKHKGDLSLYMHLKKAEQTAKKRKRGADDEDEDEDVEITAVVPRKRQRQGDSIVVGGPGPSRRPPPLGLSVLNKGSLSGFPSTPAFQTLPESPSQVPRTPIGPRTRQFSRQLESSVLDFLNSRPHLTRRETLQIQTALEDAPAHVQDNVLSAVEPAVADLLGPRNSVGSGEQTAVEKRLGKLSTRQRREVEKFMGGLQKKGRFYSL